MSEEAEIELNSYINAFKLKRKLWDSAAEEKVYRILRYYIDESYVIVPHVPFLEVFPIGDTIDQYDQRELLRKKVVSYHFDFVIFDAWYHPVLIIELNGGTHQQKEYKNEIDSFKRQVVAAICAGNKENIKLIFINELCKSLTDDELIEIIRDKLNAEIKHRINLPAYCLYCGALLQYRKGKQCWYYECKQADCTAPKDHRIKNERYVRLLLKEYTKEQELTADKLKQLIRKPNSKENK